MSVAVVLANTDGTAATTSAAQGRAVVTGVHANEEFCKTMPRIVELFGEYAKSDPIRKPDMTKRAKFSADQKALNATLVKTAPASLASGAALTTTNANAAADAELARDPARIKAAEAVSSSPQAVAANKRMKDYCGFKR